MTRDEFLRRCETIWDAGLATPERLRLLNQWLDYVLRLEGGQMNYVADFYADEYKRTDGYRTTLANDVDGYALIQLAAILCHPCQLCAEDLKAWWTRSAFCDHKVKP